MDEELIEFIKEYHRYLHKCIFAFEYYSKKEGISYTTFKILGVIFTTENCTQKYIYETISIPKQTINAAITDFYKKGYVKLTEPPEDRRVKIINLTEEGKKYAEGIFSKVMDCEYKIISQIGNLGIFTGLALKFIFSPSLNSKQDLVLGIASGARFIPIIDNLNTKPNKVPISPYVKLFFEDRIYGNDKFAFVVGFGLYYEYMIFDKSDSMKLFGVNNVKRHHSIGEMVTLGFHFGKR